MYWCVYPTLFVWDEINVPLIIALCFLKMFYLKFCWLIPCDSRIIECATWLAIVYHPNNARGHSCGFIEWLSVSLVVSVDTINMLVINVHRSGLQERAVTFPDFSEYLIFYYFNPDCLQCWFPNYPGFCPIGHESLEYCKHSPCFISYYVPITDNNVSNFIFKISTENYTSISLWFPVFAWLLFLTTIHID